jgi:hypothetical protein
VIFGWLGLILAWVLKIVVIIVGVVVLIGGLLGIIGSFGHLLVDQMRTAWEAGRSRKGILIGSFSLGTSLALILLVSTGTPESQANPIAQSARVQQLTKIRPQVPGKKSVKKVLRKKRAPAPPVYVPPPPTPIAVTVDQAWHRGGWILGSTSLTHTFAATLPKAIREWAQQSFTTASAPIFDSVVLAFVIVLSIVGAIRGLFARKEIPLEITFHNRDLLILAALPLFVIALMISASDANQG